MQPNVWGKACSQGPPLILDLKISGHPWNVPSNVKHKRCFTWMCKGNLHANGGRSFQLTKSSYVQGFVFENKEKNLGVFYITLKTLVDNKEPKTLVWLILLKVFVTWVNIKQQIYVYNQV